MKHTLPLALSLCLAAGAVQAASSNKPNIILFLVDDMGWQDCSVPMYSELSPQNRFFKTPNLEKLAAKGVKFTQAYACPLSTPSRVSLMTGMNTTRHHVSSVGNAPSAGQVGGGRANGPAAMRRQATQQSSSPLTIEDWNEQGICTDQPRDNAFLCTTLPQVLQKAGYTTMIVGKGHLGKNDCAANLLNMGFDVSIGASSASGTSCYLGSSNFSVGRARMNVPDMEAYHGQDIFLTEALSQEAIKLMDGAINKKQPFFLYMSHFAVHTPHDKDTRFYDQYIKAGASEEEAAYATLVEGVDKSLGDLMAHLDKRGISNNTIIIFMSDNGGAARGLPRDNRGKAGANAPLRSGKGSLYEGGIREPMVAYVPRLSKPGSQNNSSIIIEDFYPTIIQLAGASEESKSGQVRDSYSFVKALGGAHINSKRPFFWHYPHQKQAGDRQNSDKKGMACSAIRLGEMKLIHFYLDGSNELYDLSSDIGESKNLIGTSPEHDAMAKKLASMLSEKLREEQSPRPIKIATGTPCPYPDGSMN